MRIGWRASSTRGRSATAGARTRTASVRCWPSGSAGGATSCWSRAACTMRDRQPGPPRGARSGWPALSSSEAGSGGQPASATSSRCSTRTSTRGSALDVAVLDCRARTGSHERYSRVTRGAGWRPAGGITALTVSGQTSGVRRLRWVEPGWFTWRLGTAFAVRAHDGEWLGEVVVPPDRLVEWPGPPRPAGRQAARARLRVARRAGECRAPLAGRAGVAAGVRSRGSGQGQPLVHSSLTPTRLREMRPRVRARRSGALRRSAQTPVTRAGSV